MHAPNLSSNPPPRWLASLLLSIVITASNHAIAISFRSAALEALDKAILDDIVLAYTGHEPSECNSDDSSATSFSFEYPGNDPASDWHPSFIPYEPMLFQAIMRHKDPDPLLGGVDKSWSIRISNGGNIYSHMVPSMWGETLPPQRHGSKADSPWVDEVYQSVAVNERLNQINKEYDYPQYCEGNPGLPETDPNYGKCKKMYIHQAGAYQRDDPITSNKPFFSPSLARHCEGNTCTFAGWGTSAHVATPFTSSIFYVNRYTNCGDGIIEHTQMIYNFADPNDPASKADGGLNVNFNFFNTPWAGVRASNLPYALEPNPESNSLSFADINNVDYLRLCRFGGTNIYGDPGHDSKPTSAPAWRGQAEDLKNTGGYTAFVEQGLLVNHPVAPFQLPCRDNRKPSCEVDLSKCMVASCTDSEVRAGSHTRIQLKVAPFSSPDCSEHPPLYDNTYNYYPAVQCNMRELGFGATDGFVRDAAFPCAPWVRLAFFNTLTKEQLIVPYVRHWSWSPKNRLVYFAVYAKNVQSAINEVNSMFNNSKRGTDLIIEVRTLSGQVSNVPSNYNPGALKAFTYVYGKGEDFDGSIRGRVVRRVGGTEQGPGTRDYSVFQTQWFGYGAGLGPGDAFACRIYNFAGDLALVKETAERLLGGTFSAKINPEQWSPRKLDVYVSESGTHLAIVAANSPRGRSTSCLELTAPVCSGESTPGPRRVPYFYLTCGSSLSYFGPDPYHFAPSFGAKFPAHGTIDKPVRSYVCDGLDDITIRPTWKLMGFFGPEDSGCKSLATAAYDESVFSCSAKDNYTQSPVAAESPTASPAAEPSKETSAPTASPSTFTSTTIPTGVGLEAPTVPDVTKSPSSPPNSNVIDVPPSPLIDGSSSSSPLSTDPPSGAPIASNTAAPLPFDPPNSNDIDFPPGPTPNPSKAITTPKPTEDPHSDQLNPSSVSPVNSGVGNDNQDNSSGHGNTVDDDNGEIGSVGSIRPKASKSKPAKPGNDDSSSSGGNTVDDDNGEIDSVGGIRPKASKSKLAKPGKDNSNASDGEDETTSKRSKQCIRRKPGPTPPRARLTISVVQPKSRTILEQHSMEKIYRPKSLDYDKRSIGDEVVAETATLTASPAQLRAGKRLLRMRYARANKRPRRRRPVDNGIPDDVQDSIELKRKQRGGRRHRRSWNLNRTRQHKIKLALAIGKTTDVNGSGNQVDERRRRRREWCGADREKRDS